MSGTPQTPQTLLEVNDLKKHFALGGGLFGRDKKVLKAVDGLPFTVARGRPSRSWVNPAAASRRSPRR